MAAFRMTAGFFDGPQAASQPAGRFDPIPQSCAAGVAFPEVELPVRYIFCIAVPRALAADYLRIVGLLARVFKDPAAERELRAAETSGDFIGLLSRREAKL